MGLSVIFASEITDTIVFCICYVVNKEFKGGIGCLFDPVLTLWGGGHIDHQVWRRVIVPSDLV